MPLVEDMCVRDLSLHWRNILSKGYGGYMKSETASQSCNNCAAQHAGESILLVYVRALGKMQCYAVSVDSVETLEISSPYLDTSLQLI